jgi:hypothetical protein
MSVYAGGPRRVPSSPSEYPLMGSVARGAALRSHFRPALTVGDMCPNYLHVDLLLTR